MNNQQLSQLSLEIRISIRHLSHLYDNILKLISDDEFDDKDNFIEFVAQANRADFYMKRLVHHHPEFSKMVANISSVYQYTEYLDIESDFLKVLAAFPLDFNQRFFNYQHTTFLQDGSEIIYEAKELCELVPYTLINKDTGSGCAFLKITPVIKIAHNVQYIRHTFDLEGLKFSEIAQFQKYVLVATMSADDDVFFAAFITSNKKTVKLCEKTMSHNRKVISISFDKEILNNIFSAESKEINFVLEVWDKNKFITPFHLYDLTLFGAVKKNNGINFFNSPK